MEVKRASQLKVGDEIEWRNAQSGIKASGEVLEVRGRNIKMDVMGSTDWLYMHDLSMCRRLKGGQDDG